MSPSPCSFSSKDDAAEGDCAPAGVAVIGAQECDQHEALLMHYARSMYSTRGTVHCNDWRINHNNCNHWATPHTPSPPLAIASEALLPTPCSFSAKDDIIEGDSTPADVSICMPRDVLRTKSGNTQCHSNKSLLCRKQECASGTTRSLLSCTGKECDDTVLIHKG